jgi:hypothetical protein
MGNVVATTTHFSIEVDPSLGSSGVKNATALSQIVEPDYQKCVQWFGGTQVPYRSPDTPGFIRVLLTTLNGGSNNGSGGSIQINDYGDVESAGLVFVAELSEMFMLAQNIGWNPRDSKGEALSRLLGKKAHPTAPVAGLAFTAQNWLGTNADPAGSGNRHDWVSANEPTDMNSISTGCAILFLNYMRWQLGYGLEKIIATPGNTLEAVFQKLTGASGGFQPFSALLNRFFPIGTKPAIGDNPFPLLDSAQRGVFLNIGNEVISTAVSESGVATEGFLGCPTKPYRYNVVETLYTIEATATPIGFGLPQFAWTVNGLAATDSAVIKPIATVYRTNGPNGGSTSSQEPILLHVTITGSGKALTLFPAGLSGDAQLLIAVAAVDQFDNPTAQATSSRSSNISTERVQFEASYYQDLDRCARAFIDRFPNTVAPPFNHLAQAIAIILTLPDPPPPDFDRALRLLEHIALFSDGLTGRMHNTFPPAAREELQRLITRRLAIAPALARRIEALP